MIHGKPFSIHARISPRGQRIFYVRFRLPSGKFGNPKSTGQTSRAKAEAWALEYLNKGKPITKKGVTPRDFAGENFFDHGNEWETNKRIAGKKTPSPRWCLERRDLLKNHILPTVGDYLLTLIDEDVVTDFRNNLFEGNTAAGRAYSGATVNKILFALRDILKAAAKKRLIQAVPEIELAGEQERLRGTFTREEVRKIFSITWDNERAYIASLLSALTGARLSEVQGLMVKDIQQDGIFEISKVWERRTRTIKHNTKTKKPRRAIIGGDHLARIFRFIKDHPYPDGFLIYSEVKDTPASDTIIMRPFFRALEAIGIDKAERQRRGLSFHSWRYYCNTSMIEEGVTETTTQELLGHVGGAGMTQRYYRGEKTEGILQAQAAAVPLPADDGTPGDQDQGDRGGVH